MSLKEIEGMIKAYKNMFQMLGIVFELHSDISRSNSFIDVTMGNEKMKIKTWDLPSEMYNILHEHQHSISETNNFDMSYCCKLTSEEIYKAISICKARRNQFK